LSELSRALASVLVRPVTTSAPVLAHVVGAVVNVGRAVLPDEAGKTFTGEVGEVILAGASVLARVWFHPRAEGDLLLAVATFKPRRALTLIRSHLVNAGAVVLAPVVEAVVDVLLTPHPREARGALAQESSRLEHLAVGPVDARVAVAGVDHLGARLPVESRRAPTLKVPVWQGPT